MSIPVVILDRLCGDFVILTEAAVLGVLVSFIVVAFVFCSVRFRDLPGMFTESIDPTTVVVAIIIGATLLSPPVGRNLFVMSNVTGRPVSEVLRGKCSQRYWAAWLADLLERIDAGGLQGFSLLRVTGSRADHNALSTDPSTAADQTNLWAKSSPLAGRSVSKFRRRG